MNDKSQNKLLNEISNYFGIPQVDTNELMDINGIGTTTTMINTAYEMEIVKLTYADIISKTFNKLHRSNYITNSSFEPELRNELENAGVPRAEVIRSLKAFNKIVKEYGEDHLKDNGIEKGWMDQYAKDKDGHNDQMEFKGVGGKQMELDSSN